MRYRASVAFRTLTFQMYCLIVFVDKNNGSTTNFSTLCLKKLPTFKLSVTSSNLNRFSKFYTAGKRMKFATKTA